MNTARRIYKLEQRTQGSPCRWCTQGRIRFIMPGDQEPPLERCSRCGGEPTVFTTRLTIAEPPVARPPGDVVTPDPRRVSRLSQERDETRRGDTP